MTLRKPNVDRWQQSGLSLIELMVAMAVSLVLMLGIVSLLLANKDSYRAQNNVAVLQQNARLARFVLENAIAHAGYLEDYTTDPQHAFPDGFVSSPTNADVDNDSDALTIRFKSDGDMVDCLGDGVGSSGSMKTAHFELYVDDEENELVCAAYNTPTGNPFPQPLISNVVLMQLRYGLDSTPNDGNRGVDLYTDTLTASNRDQVRTVRVQLVLASESAIRSQPLTTGFDIAGYSEDYMPGQLFTPGSSDADDPNALSDPRRHAYVMVDQVIALRNLLP